MCDAQHGSCHLAETELGGGGGGSELSHHWPHGSILPESILGFNEVLEVTPSHRFEFHPRAGGSHVHLLFLCDKEAFICHPTGMAEGDLSIEGQVQKLDL